MKMMIMMNYFSGMADRQKAFSYIPSRYHCQRSSPSQISDMQGAGFEPAQSLSSGLVEWRWAVVITTTLLHYGLNLFWTFERVGLMTWNFVTSSKIYSVGRSRKWNWDCHCYWNGTCLADGVRPIFDFLNEVLLFVQMFQNINFSSLIIINDCYGYIYVAEGGHLLIFLKTLILNFYSQVVWKGN